MNYRLIIYLLFSFFLLSCDQSLSKKTKKIELKIDNRYKNSGFALIYDENLSKIKKLEKRSLNIYHKSLKKRSKVKITNPENGKFLIAEVKSKSKMFEEERSVAEKAPVDWILINDLNKKKVQNNKIKNKKFSYSIKIADFYYKDSAKIMINRIKNEANLKNIKIIKLSETKYRVLLGPFNDIKSLKDSFEKMNFLDFENLEILKNV